MKPITQILIATVLTIVICQYAFMVVSKGMGNFYLHKEDRMTELFKNTSKHDVIFIGSSRTHTSIDPRIIDSICNVNSYNAGVEGGNLFEFKMIWDAYLENHPAPNILVLTLDINSFDLTRKFFNYTQYYPYLNNTIIKEMLNKNGHKTFLISTFPFLQLSGFDDYTKANALRGLGGQNEIPKGDYQYKGFLTNSNKVIKDTQITASKRIAKIDAEAINLLNDIIISCKKVNTQLIFTYAPEFNMHLQNQFTNKEEVFNLIYNMALKNSIVFFRHDKLELCENPKLFANVGHLNKKGSEIYSIVLGQQIIKSTIKN